MSQPPEQKHVRAQPGVFDRPRALDPPQENEPVTRFNYLQRHAANVADPVRIDRIRAIAGTYADATYSTDEFIREKQEELRRDDE